MTAGGGPGPVGPGPVGSGPVGSGPVRRLTREQEVREREMREREVREPELVYDELRQQVRSCRETVTRLEGEEPATEDDRDAADARLGEAVDRLVAATDHLLNFEDRLPILRDLPARALSVQVVRAAALATGLGAALVVLGIWRDVLARWWAPFAVVAAVASVRTKMLPVAPAAGKHRRQRYSAAGAGIAALLVGPAATLQGWTAGVACVAVHLLCLAALLELPRGRA